MNAAPDLVDEDQPTNVHLNDRKSKKQMFLVLDPSMSDKSEESPVQTHTRKCPNHPKINRGLHDLRYQSALGIYLSTPNFSCAM